MISHSSYESYDINESTVKKNKGKLIQSSAKKQEVKASPKKTNINKHVDRDSIVHVLPSIQSPAG